LIVRHLELNLLVSDLKSSKGLVTTR